MKVCELRNILNEYDGEMEVVFSDGDGNDYDFNGTTIRIKEELELSNEKDLKEKFTVICNHCGGKNIIIEQEFDYDYEENLYSTGSYYLKCQDCGETDLDY